MELTTRKLLPGVLICFGISLSSPAARADEVYEKFVAEKSSAMVTVKFLLKMEGQFGKRESENEITGLMISPDGLVLCANSMIAGSRRFGTATPTDIKVMVGEDVEGTPGKLLARDTELDLAWVQVKEPPSKPYDYVDLEKTFEPKLGDRLISIRRMAKFFDRSPIMSEGRLSGRTKKPRDLLVPAGFSIQPGQPVFGVDGGLVGIVVLQLPDDEEMESNPMAFMSMSRDIANGLILPAAQVQKATNRAKLSSADEEEGEGSAGEKESDAGAEKKQPTTAPADQD